MQARRPPAIVLVRPSESGNIGSVARAMANTGLDELILIEPAAPCDRTARTFAVGAGEILDNVRRFDSFAEAVAPYKRLIGTSSQRKRVAKAQLFTPREMAASIAGAPRDRTALVFGTERSGLTTEELAACSMLVSIPASRRQPTLNLAQAVLVLSYELFVADRPLAAQTQRDLAEVGEVDRLLDHAQRVLGLVGFARDDTFFSVFRDLRRLSRRAKLTSREVRILRGILRRTERTIAATDDGEPADE